MRSPEGFDGTYVELFELANRVASSVVGDSADAEDIAAETMARALASWGRVRNQSRPWVLRETTDLCLRSLRKRSRRALRRRLWHGDTKGRRGVTEAAGGTAETAGGAPEAAPGAETAGEAAMSREVLLESLRHLPRRQARAVVVKYFAGSTDQEASEALGLPPAAVADQLERALSSLRRRLPAEVLVAEDLKEDEGEVGVGTTRAS